MFTCKSKKLSRYASNVLYWARAPFFGRRSRYLKKCVHYLDHRSNCKNIFDRASCTNVWLVFNWHVWYVVHVIGDMPIAPRDTASDTKQWWCCKAKRRNINNHGYCVAKACNPRTHNLQFNHRHMSGRSTTCKPNYTLLYYDSSCTYTESSHQLQPGTSSTQASGSAIHVICITRYVWWQARVERDVLTAQRDTTGDIRQAVMVSRTIMWGHEDKAETQMGSCQQM